MDNAYSAAIFNSDIIPSLLFIAVLGVNNEFILMVKKQMIGTSGGINVSYCDVMTIMGDIWWKLYYTVAPLWIGLNMPLALEHLTAYDI